MTAARRAFVALAIALLVPARLAWTAEFTEASIKAAFLYKFAGYIDWPPGSFEAPGAPFVIGVMDADDVAAELGSIVAGRHVGTHPVVARRLKEGEPTRGVNMLFVGRDAGERLKGIVGAAQMQGSIVVTEGEKGLDSGSAINFVDANDRVAFEVSVDAAERTGHHISARMLAVARRVVQKGA